MTDHMSPRNLCIKPGTPPPNDRHFYVTPHHG